MSQAEMRGSLAKKTLLPVATKAGSPYPLHWRIFDLLDDIAERLFPPKVGWIAPAAMLMPAALVVGLLAYGFLLILEQSFHTLDPQTFTLRSEYSLENYVTVFTRPEYANFIFRTVGTGLSVAAVSLLLGFPYAYALVRTRSKRLKKLLLFCAFLPFLLGSVMRSFAWLVILGRTGLVNDILGYFGIGPIPLVYNYTGVFIGLIQINIPLTVLILVPALTAINEQVEEAAQSLGAHWLRVMRTVVLPMAAPGIASAFLIVFTLCFSEMIVPTMLGGGRNDLIANAIFESYMTAADLGNGAALCIVTTVAVILTVLIFYGLRRSMARRGG